MSRQFFNSNNNRRMPAPQLYFNQTFEDLPAMNMLGAPLMRVNSNSSIASSKTNANAIAILTKSCYHNFDIAFDNQPFVARCFIMDAPANDVSMKRAVRTLYFNNDFSIEMTHQKSAEFILDVAVSRRKKRLSRLEKKLKECKDEVIKPNIEKALDRLKRIPTYTKQYFARLSEIAKPFVYKKPT